MEASEDRLRGLIDAGGGLSSELTLGAVLQRLVRAGLEIESSQGSGTTLVAEVPLP